MKNRLECSLDGSGAKMARLREDVVSGPDSINEPPRKIGWKALVGVG